MKRWSWQAGLLFALIPCGAVQAQTVTFGDGQPSPRQEVRIFYWDQGAKKSPGQFSIHYAAPVWQAKYDDQAEFDKLTVGKTIRLGKNLWTTLDTNLPLSFGDRKVAPGSYFLALARSEDGKNWSLAFIDSAKARAQQLDAFQSDMAPIAFQVPLGHAMGDKKVEELSISLATDAEDVTEVTLNIDWGKHQLRAALKAHIQPAG